MKDLSKVLFGFTVIALLGMTLLWWRNVAVRRETVIKREVVTVVDTVTVERIETKWREIVKQTIDTTFVVRPDTVLVTEYIVDLSHWQEKVLRMSYRPPILNYTTAMGQDTVEIKAYEYREVPWGFLLYPDERGRLLVQNLDSPAISRFSSGYNWGIGALWFNSINPAGFAEYYFSWKKFTFTGLANVSSVGVSGGLYLRWR